MEITKSRKTALIVGATGLIGKQLTQELLRREVYSKVRILVRSPLSWSDPKLDVHYVNFARLDDYRELFAVDDVFCCLGTTMAKAGSKDAFYEVDYTYVFQTARLGAVMEAHQFLLVSSAGADAESMFFYSRVKGEVEAAVRELPYWAVHIFRPSLLLGEREEQRLGERIAKGIGQGLDFILGNWLGRYRPVEGKTVAVAMVNAAQDLESGVHLHENESLPAMAQPALAEG